MKAYESSPNMNPPPSLVDDVIDEIEAADYLGVCDRTLRNLRRRGHIPFSRIGGRVIYLRSKLHEWLLAGGTKQFETKGCDGIIDTK